MALSFPFVGRAQEQAELQARIRSAAGGRGGLVLLGGEAGTGKTALLQVVLPAAADCLAVTGGCPGPGETPPYGPWIEAIDRLRRDSGWQTDALPPPFGAAPGLWSTYELAGSLVHWLGRHGRPLVVRLEDLHWADAASLDLTRHLAARLPEWPVLAIATYRTDEISRRHPLWHLLPELQRAGAARILLDRLTRADVAELTAGVLPPELDAPEAADLVYTRTGGLALFVREVLEAAVRTGRIPRPGQPLPETLQQAIDSKLDRLPPAARALLEPAAVIGEHFAFDLLARVAQVAEDDLTEALEEAVARHVIRPRDADGSRFAFTHALLREALLARLIGSRRRRWHARIADALAAGPGADPDAVAFHLTRAGDPRAAQRLLAAGDRARQVGALAQGRERYEQALALLPPTHPHRGELLLKLGWCLHRSDPARAGACWREAAEIAAAAGERPVAVWARHMLLLLARGRNDPRWQEQATAVQAAQEELLADPGYQQLEADLFGRCAGYPRAGAVLAGALALSGALEEARARLRELSARALAGPDHEILSAAMVLSLVGGRMDEAAAQCGEAAETALDLRDYRSALVHRSNQLLIRLIGAADRPDEIDALAAAVRDLEEEVWQRAGYAQIRRGFSVTGTYLFLRGDWRGGWHHVVEAARQCPGPYGEVLGWYAGLILLSSADPESARPFVEALPPLRPTDPVPVNNNLLVLAHYQRAELYLSLGEALQARTWLEAAEHWPALGAAPFYRACIRLGWARYHQCAGNLEPAWRAAAEGLMDARAATSSIMIIRSHRLLGELAAARGDGAAAMRHFQAALDLAGTCRFPFEAALTLLARGRALAGTPAGRADLESACAYFADVGAGPALAAGRRALGASQPAAGAAGVHLAPGHPAPAGLPDGLTAREAEVAALVARGLTDREIAARLFISRKTVDRHLRNIFQKVGVGSRAALAAYATRHGLVG